MGGFGKEQCFFPLGDNLYCYVKATRKGSMCVHFRHFVVHKKTGKVVPTSHKVSLNDAAFKRLLKSKNLIRKELSNQRRILRLKEKKKKRKEKVMQSRRTANLVYPTIIPADQHSVTCGQRGTTPTSTVPAIIPADRQSVPCDQREPLTSADGDPSPADGDNQSSRDPITPAAGDWTATSYIWGVPAPATTSSGIPAAGDWSPAATSSVVPAAATPLFFVTGDWGMPLAGDQSTPGGVPATSYDWEPPEHSATPTGPLYWGTPLPETAWLPDRDADTVVFPDDDEQLKAYFQKNITPLFDD